MRPPTAKHAASSATGPIRRVTVHGRASRLHVPSYAVDLQIAVIRAELHPSARSPERPVNDPRVVEELGLYLAMLTACAHSRTSASEALRQCAVEARDAEAQDPAPLRESALGFAEPPLHRQPEMLLLSLTAAANAPSRAA